MPSDVNDRRPWVRVVATLIAVLVAVGAAALIPEICPAVSPAPPGCAPDARESTAILVGIVLLMLGVVATVAVSTIPPAASRRSADILVIALIVAGVLGLGIVLFASGFGFPAVGF